MHSGDVFVEKPSEDSGPRCKIKHIDEYAHRYILLLDIVDIICSFLFIFTPFLDVEGVFHELYQLFATSLIHAC